MYPWPLWLIIFARLMDYLFPRTSSVSLEAFRAQETYFRSIFTDCTDPISVLALAELNRHSRAADILENLGRAVTVVGGVHGGEAG